MVEGWEEKKLPPQQVHHTDTEHYPQDTPYFRRVMSHFVAAVWLAVPSDMLGNPGIKLGAIIANPAERLRACAAPLFLAASQGTAWAGAVSLPLSL